MKNKVFLLCSITLLIVAIAAVYVWQTQTTNEQPLTQNHASDSESLTTLATGERIKIAEGLYQVLDDNQLQATAERTYFTQEDFDQRNYLLQTLSEDTEADNCALRGIEKRLEESPGIIACTTYNPETYNTFLILNKNKEVLYRFEVDELYSFVSTQGGVYEVRIAVFWKRGNETDGPLLQFAVSYWNDFSDLEAASSQIYYFYPKTGRLFYQSENGSETEIYLKAMSTK